MLTPVEIAAVINATKSAVDIFDKISGQIKTVLKKQPKEPEGGEDRWRYKISADDSEQIVVKQDGRTIQTLTRDQLSSVLTPEHLQHIKTYEASMKKYYRYWQALYPKKDTSPDHLANVQLEDQLTDQIRKMKNDLSGIIDFLRSIGVQLDDHYMEVRHLVRQLDEAG
jgi:hypothetical protein